MMIRVKTLVIAAAMIIAFLARPVAINGGLFERWPLGGKQIDGGIVRAADQQVGTIQPSTGQRGEPAPKRGDRTRSDALEVGPDAGAALEPIPVRAGPAAHALIQVPAPAASPPHDVIVEVPTGVCTKKQVCVHCRGCEQGRCIKVCGCLPPCVSCEPRTFRVINPMNGCPVDVTACLPGAPEKARKIERDPYYITYHFPDCRITLWFLFERNNDYIVKYASERSF